MIDTDKKYFSEYFDSIDGKKLFIQGWLPQEIRGIICLLHGLGEHTGRFEEFAENFVENRFAVIGMDIRGHGHSEGLRGHTPSYKHLMKDINYFLDKIRRKFNKDIILYGHSMGGNLVLNYTIRNDASINGVIASAPWLKLAFEPSKMKIYLAKLMENIWPQFTRANEIDIEKLSHDDKIVNEYINDELVHDRISAGMFYQVYQAGEYALNNADKLDISALIMQGTADEITSIDASREFVDTADMCEFKSWPGFYHEIHNEPDSYRVYDYIFQWVEGIIR